GNTISRIVWISGRMMPAPIAWTTLERISTPKFGDQPPMIVPISRHVSENMTSVLAEKVRDKYPDIGMNMMVVRMKALVSHWTWVALTLNSSMIVGNAVIRRNWLKVNKKAAAMITTTTPLLSIFSSAMRPLRLSD